MTEGMEVFRREFINTYGEKEGTRVLMNVLPGILGDFRKMVLHAAEGEAVTEEYRVEDRKMTVKLCGVRRGAAAMITEAVFNGKACAVNWKLS